MFSFQKLIENKKRPLVMGVLNITPDSFSDGGESFSLSGALERLHCLEKEGADIIDIGACSTAPMNELVSCDEEINRLSFLPELVKNASVPLSIDTFRPEVAEFALKNGVSIVNDESGCFSQAMAEVVKKYNAGWIFMHTGGKSSKDVKEYPNGVINDVLNYFEDCYKKATDFGINKDSLFFDFGIGFGKSRDDDLLLLSECEKITAYYPLLVGVSRKRIIGEIVSEKDAKNRVAGSVAAAALVAYKGAGILRVHDVKETVDAMNIVSAVVKGYIQMYNKIIIKGLRLKAYHGVNPEEKVDGQMFELDITTLIDTVNADNTDDLENTVSYAKIIKTVRAVFTAESYNLIEYAANKVCVSILEAYPSLQSVTVLLKKPEAPISADFDYVAVEETLTREEFEQRKAK